MTPVAVLLASMLLLMPTTKPDPARPQPGTYEGLQLGVDPVTGALSGYFFNEEDDGKFSCGFLLYSDGKHGADGVYNFTTWWPAHEVTDPKLDDEVFPGKLRLTGASVTLQVPAQAHGGCWHVEPELDQGKPQDYTLTTKHPAWLQQRVVRVAKLNLSATPDEKTPGKAYVVKGDVLTVTARQGNWLAVEFFPEAKDHNGPVRTIGSKGWVPESALLPVTPPTTSAGYTQ